MIFVTFICEDDATQATVTFFAATEQFFATTDYIICYIIHEEDATLDGRDNVLLQPHIFFATTTDSNCYHHSRR